MPDTVRNVARTVPDALSSILMAPPCSTTNKRVWSPGGLVRNTGELRLFATVWSLRPVEVGAGFCVSLLLPHAARSQTKYTQDMIQTIARLIGKSWPCLKDGSHPT